MAVVFQCVFAVIATDPVRFRLMMIPAALEKFSYVMTVVVLVVQQRMHASDLVFAVTDFLLGLLFMAAFVKTRSLEIDVFRR